MRTSNIFYFISTYFLFIINFSGLQAVTLPDYPAFISDTSHWVDSVYNSLSPEERIAQLIMAPLYPNKDSADYDRLKEEVQQYNIGGIVLFNGGPVKTAVYVNELQSFAKTPILVGIDAEWGLTMRMDSTIQYPKQIMLGAMVDNQLIYQMASDIAWQCHRMGIHINFAPVVDINYNPRNPIINSRSFGQDRDKVFVKGLAYMQGLQDNGIISTAKHFPGHGDTESDSHFTLPMILHPFNRLDSVELFPFRKLINKGLSGIMVAHLYIPGIDSTTNRPSTLSPVIIDSLLRKKMNFKGLIFTDALNMKGVTDYGSSNDIAVKALKAGNDILLMPEDIPAVIGAIKSAVDSGIISQNEINSKCKKILLAKYWAGLAYYKPIELKNLYADLHQKRFELTRRKLVESAITILKNDNDLLPLKRLDTLRIACVSVGYDSISLFQQTLGLYADIKNYYISRDASPGQFDSLKKQLAAYNLVIVSLINTDMRATKNFGITDKSVNFIKQLADTANVVFDLFANPYALEKFVPSRNFKAIIMSYEDKLPVQDLSAQLIMGGIVANGALPVTASEEYAMGASLKNMNRIRLKYTMPEELGIASDSLSNIDSIVNDAIKHRAFPGCEVYVAQNGKVIYYKAFGFHTYDSITPVKTTDIYDLASITKIAATVPAIMWLYERKSINLSQHLSRYLPFFDKYDKGKIVIRDLLTHQARLQSFMPFYMNTLRYENSDGKHAKNIPSQATSVKSGEAAFSNSKTRYIEGLYSRFPKPGYELKVADSLYLINSYQDTIYEAIYNSKLNKINGYYYSDLGFMLLYKLVMSKIDKPFDCWLDSALYKPLGAKTLGFLPLGRNDRNEIVPTENDLIFRKQIVQGYVHDQTCAMLGGVCGHAGLFANANDLGKLMQMYLQKGEYGDLKYFNSKTINLFTSRPYYKTGNRRGLGFDKPEPSLSKQSPVARCVSDLSYGHSGFTGTMTWVDPEKQLVYIFLSNRVYPNADNNKLVEMNVRTRIQEVIYKALIH